MEEQTPTEEQSPPLAPRPRMSLPARLLNVFAVPGEVFAELRRAPSSPSNWLVPAFFAALVGALSTWILLSQPVIQQQFKAERDKMVEKQLKIRPLTPMEKRAVEWFGKPAVLKSFASGGAAALSFCNVLWWGFVLWFLARGLFRVPVPFSKTVEAAGLATMINVLGGIVAILLLVNLGRPGASPSLALLVKDFDATRKGHLFAAAANVFTIWVVGVRSIGLAKLAGVPYLRAAWAVFTFWLLQQSLLILMGAGQVGT